MQDDGIKRGSLSQAKARQDEEREIKGFAYGNLFNTKPELWESIAEFYGIDEVFPCEYLYVQQEGNQRRIVLVSEGMHKMMVTCKKKVKLQPVNIGLKLFERNKSDKSQASYRLVQEGLEVLLPFMNGYSRQFKVTSDFFTAMLAEKDYHITFEKISTLFGQPLSQKFKDAKLGSAILQFSPKTIKNEENEELLSVTVWIGVNNVSLMLNKEEITSFKFLLQ